MGLASLRLSMPIGRLCLFPTLLLIKKVCQSLQGTSRNADLIRSENTREPVSLCAAEKLAGQNSDGSLLPAVSFDDPNWLFERKVNSLPRDHSMQERNLCSCKASLGQLRVSLSQENFEAACSMRGRFPANCESLRRSLPLEERYMRQTNELAE